jgi:hypothetical protein
MPICLPACLQFYECLSEDVIEDLKFDTEFDCPKVSQARSVCQPSTSCVGLGFALLVPSQQVAASR